jgi:hypothetical protein
MDAILASLQERGFLQIGDLKSTLENVTVEILKTILSDNNLKTSGKKSELIQRIIDEIPPDIINEKFPRRVYQLTGLGKEEISKEEYVIYIHSHSKENLGIWSLNKMVYDGSHTPYRDKIWAYLDRRGNEHLKNQNFGLYRNCRYSMYDFLIEEDKINEALQMLAEVVFYDLCGADNNYSPETSDISAEYFFPYENSSVTIAPRVIVDISKCQEILKYSDKELKNALLVRIRELTAPIQLFTPEECVDIYFLEHIKDTEGLTRIYSTAEQRFKKKWKAKLP